MVLLLFAAPMIDGVLTLFQNESFDETTSLNESFDETTFFETSVYAHPENPSVGEEHKHKLKEYWETCKDGVKTINKIAVFAVWIGVATSGNGGSRQQTIEMQRQADTQSVLATKECPEEESPPPPPPPPLPPPPPGDGDNDNDNDSDN